VRTFRKRRAGLSATAGLTFSKVPPYILYAKFPKEKPLRMVIIGFLQAGYPDIAIPTDAVNGLLVISIWYMVHRLFIDALCVTENNHYVLHRVFFNFQAHFLRRLRTDFLEIVPHDIGS